MGASIGPRIELENEDGYVRSLKNITAETKAYASGLKELQASFDRNTSAWEKSQKTAIYLADEISAQLEKIKLLNDELAKVEPNSTKAFDIQDKINKARTALHEMTAELMELPNHLQAIGQEWEDLGGKFQDAGKSVSKVGDTVSVISAPVAAGIGVAVKTVEDFEAEMAKAWSVTGAFDQSLTELEKQNAFEALSAKAREMGETTKFTASEAAEAIYYMGLAGWDTNEVLAGLSGVMNLAAASGEGLARTSDIVTDSLTAFGETAEVSDHFANVLAATMANSNTKVDLMGESFKYVGALAGSLNYSIDDVALALGLMANAGVKGGQAGTALRQALKYLIDPANEAAGALMDELGISLFDTEEKAYSFGEVISNLRGIFGNVNVDVEEMARVLEDEGEEGLQNYVDSLNVTMTDQKKLTDIVEIFGTRALPAVLAIVNATEEDYNKLASAIETSSDAVVVNGETFQGVAAGMSALQLNTLSGQLTILKDGLSELAISFGNQMLPTLMELIGKAKIFVENLNRMDESTKEMILKVGLFVAAAGPVLSIGGRLITGIGTITSGIGGLLKFAGGLVTLPAKLAGGAGKITGAIGTVSGAIGAAGGGTGIIGGLGSLVAGFAPFLIGGAVVVGLGIGVYEIVKHWDEIKEKAGELRDKLSAFWGDVETGADKLKNNIRDHFDETKGKFESFGDDVSRGWDRLKTNTVTTWETIKGKVEENGGGITGVIKTSASGWETLIKNVWETADKKTDGAFSNMLKTVMTKTSDIHDKIGEMVGGIVKVFTDLPGQALQWGKDMIGSFVKGIKEFANNPIKAIGDIAQGIKDRVGHSHPKEGPLADDYLWMPDMMKLFAQGIRDNENLVIDQIEKSFDFSDLLADQTVSVNGTASTNKALSVGGMGNITMNIYGAEGQDVRELARIVEQEITFSMNRRSAAYA